jgi:hypothetical protein
MSKLRYLAAAAALVAALGATSAEAQVLGPAEGAGNDMLTLNLFGGGYSPASSLTAGSEFRNSGTVGVAATLWVHPLVGVRANGLFARTDASQGVPEGLKDEKPNVWAYSGDLVLRLPFSTANGRDTWFPYLLGGLGGKTYDFDQAGTETDFAGNVGAGIEYRIGRWGVQAEVRDIISTFDRFGIDKTQHDVVWTGGITLSF